jgi:hypothetical protein
MAELVIALGINADGDSSVLYLGQDFTAAQDATHQAGTNGTIILGNIYRNPAPVITLRY